MSGGCGSAAAAQVTEPEDVEALRAEIREGLGRAQKVLPTKLLYDHRGSELFEEITRLPEYYLTRAEESLLRAEVPGWIEALRPGALVELGAGSAVKTRVILDAMGAAEGGRTYVPVDISGEFLGRTARELRQDYPDLRVAPVVADFTRPFPLPTGMRGPVLFTFLGSTIGNFPPAEAVDLLSAVAAAMDPRDRLLLGADLRKDVSVLEAAYDDAAGVTAEFNLNLLRVVNRDFGADFDLSAYRHRAVYDAREHRIEMHLVAVRRQTVRLPRAGSFDLAAGESIRTEISCKYDRSAVAETFSRAGLDLADWRSDAEGRFALALAARSAV